MNEDDELESLLRKVKAGDSDARQELYKLLLSRARHAEENVVSGRLGSRTSASDVAQEAMMRVWKNFDPHRFECVGQLINWLRKIVKNVVKTEARRHYAEKRDVRCDAGEDLLLGKKTDTTGPDERMERKEQESRQMALLNAALQRLPEIRRIVFLLRERDALTYEEIAAHAGVSVGNARVLHLRALRQLRDDLGDDWGDQT